MLPVKVFAEDPPIVMPPLVVVKVRVPLPPSVTSPASAIAPVLVVILPPFHVSAPPTVNEALVELAAARS